MGETTQLVTVDPHETLEGARWRALDISIGLTRMLIEGRGDL